MLIQFLWIEWSACLTRIGTGAGWCWHMSVLHQSAHQLEHLTTRRVRLQFGLQCCLIQSGQIWRDHKVGRGGEGSGAGSRAGVSLGNNTVVHLLQMLLHLVRTRKFFLAHWTWEHLTLLALMIQEGMALEAVLVLEGLQYLHLLTFKTPEGAITRHLCILQQVQPSHRHIL